MASPAFSSNLVALLGPTNTGKTHRAIERMLEHKSGMMGFPLRLLAREVYDRVCSSVGAQKVALLTGEERKVPKHARYWLCTVEAMPQDLAVEFVAIDEVQLATDKERGHVFTQHICHTRGSSETWFLGAWTMHRVLTTLFPHLRVDRKSRLSTLSYAGKVSLSALPKRTAVVALSRRELYPIAEHIRQRKGGVALVLGALSPNARNAQVELFQSGKVDYLVATDAIGMGLNLDVEHVVFASLSKYDGQRRRALFTDEVAQIAGRAGRHLRDGYFYTLHNGPQLNESVIRSVENHRFESKSRLVWRNAKLDFSSLPALIESLRAPSPRPLFQKLQRADDFEALLWLSQRKAVLSRIKGQVQRLWTVCQIPDYRKLMLDRHFLLLEEIFVQLCDGQGKLDEDWVKARLARVDKTEGGIELLMTRLAFIRTWNYVVHRPGWVANAAIWQRMAQDVEERVSQALHEALMLRFTDRSVAGQNKGQRHPATPKKRSQTPPKPEVTLDPDHPFAGLSTLIEQRGDAQPASTTQSWLDQWLGGDDSKLLLQPSAQLLWDRAIVARLVRGSSLVQPEILLEPAIDEQMNARERSTLLRRLHRFVHAQIVQHLLPVSPSLSSGAARALDYAIRQNAGICPWDQLPRKWRRGHAHAGEGLNWGWLYVLADGLALADGQRVRQALVRAAWPALVWAKQSSARERLALARAHGIVPWVCGYHECGGRGVEVAGLEAALTKALGSPTEAKDQMLRPDPGPLFGLSSRAWVSLLASLGWTKIDSGALVYQARNDRYRRRGR